MNQTLSGVGLCAVGFLWMNASLAMNAGADDPQTKAADPQLSTLLAAMTELPPEVKPGECYVRVKVPAKYETIEERLLVKPESVRYEIMPAEFKMVEKEVVVKPESITYEIVPAEYESKEFEVVVAPEHTQITATEPEFQSEENKVETRAARLVLKLDANPLSAGGLLSNGEVLSLAQDPAEVKTYTRSLLIKPAQVKQEKVAPAIEKIATQVLVKPAEVKEVKVPAEIRKLMVRELVRPATKKEIKVPAEYTTVTRSRLVSPERIVWQRILCASEMTPEMITAIQTKLKEKGVEPGELNGQLSDATKAAIGQYQSQNALAQGGLTFELLDHLGIKP